MPTYEYECQRCGHQFEEYQSITASPLTDCAADGCRGQVKRLIGAGGGLLFKGSGFYITDYRSEGYKKAEKADRKDSSVGSADKSKSKSSEGSSSSTPKKATANKSDK